MRLTIRPKFIFLIILIISLAFVASTYPFASHTEAAETYRLPVKLTVQISSATSANTEIAVYTGWASKIWYSQKPVSPGDYEIGVRGDGSVVSMDGKLSFKSYAASSSDLLQVNIRYPDVNHNGADFINYKKNGLELTLDSYGYTDYGSGNVTYWMMTGGNTIRSSNATEPLAEWYVLPQYFKIHVATVTPRTRIQVSTFFNSSIWVSQPILVPGDYVISVNSQGFVRSIDSKLGFNKYPTTAAPLLSVMILYPDSQNGADVVRYFWSYSNNPKGAINRNAKGFYNFDSDTISSQDYFSDGNDIAMVEPMRVWYNAPFTIRVHLESVTQYTYLHIPFYWKRVIYRSQRGLAPGDYWIRVNYDPDPYNLNTRPTLTSLDGKLSFETIYSREAADQVFAVFIALPTYAYQGFDVVGFNYNFAYWQTYTTMLGADPTGIDVGLGFVYTDVLNPRDDITNWPTTPTENLTSGNYVVITDATYSNANSHRIYGQTSHGTAVEISKAGWSSSNVVLLARDDHFSDALSGVPLAYSYINNPMTNTPVPILLTNPDNLSPESLAEMRRLGTRVAVVLGGPGAISERVLSQLRENGIAPDRIWQNSSYGTAADVARRMRFYALSFGAQPPSTAIIATGENFQDALAVSSPAAANNMPVLLTKRDQLPAETVEVLQDLGIRKAIIVGGQAVISDNVKQELEGRGIQVLARFAGNDQYETARKIAMEGNGYFRFTYPGEVFLVRGDHFSDGLAGGALASRRNPAPIILVEPTRLTGGAESYLASNLNNLRKAHILGGPGAISPLVADEVTNYLR